MNETVSALKNKPITLRRIESIHELREGVIYEAPSVGIGKWIEILDFDKKTEKVDIKQRLEIVELDEIPYDNGKKCVIILRCKKKDFKKEFAESKHLAEQVINKHEERLKASLVKCYIEGISEMRRPALKNITKQFDKIMEEIDNEKKHSG